MILGVSCYYGRGPQLYQYSTDRAPPLLSLQIFICLYIFLEGNEGVKERRLQNDQEAPKCQRFFMNVASFTARSKKDNSQYSAERNNLRHMAYLASPPVCERTDFIAYFIRIF